MPSQVLPLLPWARNSLRPLRNPWPEILDSGPVSRDHLRARRSLFVQDIIEKGRVVNQEVTPPHPPRGRNRYAACSNRIASRSRSGRS